MSETVGMSVADVVAALDAMQTDDCEGAHADADALLLSIMPTEIQEAMARLHGRCRWWACA